MHAETRVEFPAKEGCLCSYETLFFFFLPLSLTLEARWGKILTIDLLMKRGWLMVKRCLWKESKKSTDHILILYERTKGLWMSLLTMFGMNWVFPLIVRNLLLKLRDWIKRDDLFGKWHPCLFWCIWKERNHWIFKMVKSSQIIGWRRILLEPSWTAQMFH